MEELRAMQARCKTPEFIASFFYMIIATTHTKRKGEEAVKISRRQNKSYRVYPPGRRGREGRGRQEEGKVRPRDGEGRAQHILKPLR